QGIEDAGGRAKGIPGIEVFTAKRIQGTDPEDGSEVDIGFVGRVTECRLDQINDLIAKNIVPVVSPIGRGSRSGSTLNVNADLAACALGGAIKASKILFLSDVLGVMENPDDDQSLIASLDRTEVTQRIEDGTISGGMIPKVQSALEALDAGVEKAHLIDGRIPHSVLLETFTEKGIGTEIIC
ncbi:MAG: acetylglutamate kinase, partial [Verrucomicrobiota bacterium]